MGERDRLRAVLVFGRAAPTLVRGRRGGIVSFGRLCGGATPTRRLCMKSARRHDGTFARGQPLSGTSRRGSASAVMCAVPLSRSDGVLGVLDLAAGIAHFQESVAETSPESALVGLRRH